MVDSESWDFSKFADITPDQFESNLWTRTTDGDGNASEDDWNFDSIQPAPTDGDAWGRARTNDERLAIRRPPTKWLLISISLAAASLFVSYLVSDVSVAAVLLCWFVGGPGSLMSLTRFFRLDAQARETLYIRPNWTNGAIASTVTIACAAMLLNSLLALYAAGL